MDDFDDIEDLEALEEIEDHEVKKLLVNSLPYQIPNL